MEAMRGAGERTGIVKGSVLKEGKDGMGEGNICCSLAVTNTAVLGEPLVSSHSGMISARRAV
jgi:hypothetical protein